MSENRVISEEKIDGLVVSLIGLKDDEDSYQYAVKLTSSKSTFEYKKFIDLNPAIVAYSQLKESI